MGEVYVIVSGKGGVGKTTSAINLGSSMHNFGKEVIIVDGNLTTPNIGLHLGSPIVPITLNHVICNKAKPEEAVYEHESGIKILPASLSLADLERAEHSRLASVARRLRKIADIIIMDSSAGLGEEARAAIKSGDKIIVIATPEMASITDALKAIKLSEKLRKNVHGCIITRHLGRKGRKIDMDIPTIHDMLEVPILGVIPEDRAIRESHLLKKPVIFTHPRSRAARAYRRAAARILGPEYYKKEAQRIAGEKQSIFRRILKKMGFGR